MVIVGAVNQSDRGPVVAAEAARIAEAFDDTLHLVHVMSTSDFVGEAMSDAKTTGEVDMDDVRERAAEVAAEMAADVEYSYEPVGLIGNVAPKVVEYVAEHDARYVVVGGRKRSPAGKAIFGSTPQSILLNASCPVVSVLD